MLKGPLWAWIIGAAVLVAALGATGAAVVASTSAPTASSASPSPREGDAGGVQDPVSTATNPPAPGVVVTHVDIPDIGVSSDLELLNLDGNGALLPPVGFAKAGWYQGGVLPGDVGPAIIAGHVDSAHGPAIFAHLGDVQPGSKITVTLSDGRALTFEVQKSEKSLKTQFPTSDVYGNVPTPQLRVITCGGPFDPRSGHYTENLVLFATLVS
ncbi:sortase [Glaciihabitans sp. UYNi722]|uniref:sortase domain-containing protein n=1 Tax=Glaciihabitans sp. UYNi722 TaxID=3156344 RepID=UPI00339ADC3D